MYRADINAVGNQLLVKNFDIFDVKDQLDQRLTFFLTLARRMEHQDQAICCRAQFDNAVALVTDRAIDEKIAIEADHFVDFSGVNNDPVAGDWHLGFRYRLLLAAARAAEHGDAIDDNPAIAQKFDVIIRCALFAGFSGGEAVNREGNQCAEQCRAFGGADQILQAFAPDQVDIKLACKAIACGLLGDKLALAKCF